LKVFEGLFEVQISRWNFS